MAAMPSKRKRVPCQTCKQNMNAAPNDKPNPCPLCGQGRGSKRGIVVPAKMCRCGCGQLALDSKFLTMKKLGIKAMKPGEVRKVRLIVEEP